MMYAWSFAARMIDEVSRLVRSMSKHRYLKEADLRLHWAVDAALTDLPGFEEHARAFARRRVAEPELDIRSREPTLWRPASADEVVAVLTAFWDAGDAADQRREKLLEILHAAGFTEATHEPFHTPPEEPPHPELVLLDWVLFPVDELDADRHKGALAAMAEAGEEVDASAPVYQEGPVIAAPELCFGARQGILEEDFQLWSEPPYSYADYVFRGVSKSAKLVDPPVGYRDL